MFNIKCVCLCRFGLILLGCAVGGWAQMTASADPPKPDAAPPRQLAFPGAQGFGAYTQGGRGGRVIAVTNLNDDGPGSLREACNAQGPRIIVFRTGGNIRLKKYLTIREPFVTIAGQTAPGDGVCITAWSVHVETHEVVIRGLRVRPGDEKGGPKGSNQDALAIGKKDAEVHHVILDHCSFSWAIDENLSTWYPCRDITIQWCITSEALYRSHHEKGPHSMGLLIGDHAKRVSVHHNLLAHNNYRNPQPKGDTVSETINNVIYNWGQTAIQFSDPEGSGPSQAHIIKNVLIPGRDSAVDRGCVDIAKHMAEGTQVYLEGNQIEGNKWPLLLKRPTNARNLSVKPVFADSGLKVDPVEKVREQVLKEAGAILPQRDAVDVRIVEDVRKGTGQIIDSQKQVGGWPIYQTGEAPPDSDNDGMPDEWETRHGLDPKNADGNGDLDKDGYTNIEEYLNATDPRIKD